MAARSPRATVSVGGFEVACTRVSVSNGLAQPSASLRATLDEDSAHVDIPSGRQNVACTLGYDGESMEDAFTGFTGGDTPSLVDEAVRFESELVAVGRKALLSAPLSKGVTFGYSVDGVTDDQLAQAIFAAAGITSGFNIAVTGLSLGLTGPLLTARRERVGRGKGALLALLRRLDTVSDCWTADQRDGTLRRAPWGDPAAGTCFIGTSALVPFSNARSLDDARTGVKVLGYVYPDEPPLSTQGPTWVPSIGGVGVPVWTQGPRTWAYNRPYSAMAQPGSPLILSTDPLAIDWEEVADDLIEVTAHAAWLVARLVARLNQAQAAVTAVLEGDATIDVGMIATVGVDDAKASGSYLVTAVQHDWDLETPAATTRVTLAPLATSSGASGFELAPTLAVDRSGVSPAVCTATVLSDASDPNTMSLEWWNDQDAQRFSGSNDPTADDYAGIVTFAFAPEVAALNPTIFCEARDPSTRIRVARAAA